MLRATQIWRLIFSYSIYNSLLQLELMQLSTCLQSSTFSSLRMNRHLLFSQCQTVKHLIKPIEVQLLSSLCLLQAWLLSLIRCAPVGTYNCIYHVDYTIFPYTLDGCALPISSKFYIVFLTLHSRTSNEFSDLSQTGGCIKKRSIIIQSLALPKSL